MDLRRLETFCKVAELESFSRAAEAIYLTQPTVSGHITTLERDMGLKLFDRLGRKAALTDAGRILYRYSKDLLKLRDEAVNALSDYSQSMKGKITIGGSTVPGEYFLPRVIGRFHQEVSGVTVSLVIGDSQEIADLLLDGDVEVAVTGMRFDGKKMDARPLFRDRVIIICHPNNPLAGKTHVSWDEVVTSPMVIRERGSGTRTAFETYAAAAGYRIGDLAVVAELGNSTAVKEAVKAGLGLGFISDLAVREELSEGKIRELRIDGPQPPTREFYTITRRGRQLSPPGRRFMEFLSDWGA
jgi:DNA-binding transcriptional LysR family regulator